MKNDGPRPVKELYGLYKTARAAGGNLLLNVPPDNTGRIPEADVKALMELKQQIDQAAKPTPVIRATVSVEEKRLPNGDSELSLKDSQGKVLESAAVNLSTHHQPATTVDDPLVKKFQSWRYGAFLCYNSNQFSGSEHCTLRDPRQYAPAKLDVKQWVQTIKAAGMKYAVLTTRHTSGFLLWDSPTSEFDVAGSSDKTDVVKAYVEECRKADIVPGLYYCMWGGPKLPKDKQAETRTDSPRAVVLWQLRELATRYGEIPYFWIDMMNWAPADLKPQEVYDLLKNINPDCVVILNQHIQDGRKIAYFPTDVLNGEVTCPPASGHQAVRTVGGASYYLPFEFEPCSQWRPNQKSPGNQTYVWFTYGAGKEFEASRSYTVPAMLKTLTEAWRCGTTNVLLSCAPTTPASSVPGTPRRSPNSAKSCARPS